MSPSRNFAINPQRHARDKLRPACQKQSRSVSEDFSQPGWRHLNHTWTPVPVSASSFQALSRRPGAAFVSENPVDQECSLEPASAQLLTGLMARYCRPELRLHSLASLSLLLNQIVFTGSSSSSSKKPIVMTAVIV